MSVRMSDDDSTASAGQREERAAPWPSRRLVHQVCASEKAVGSDFRASRAEVGSVLQQWHRVFGPLPDIPDAPPN